MTSPLIWGAAVLIFVLSIVLNTLSTASGFDIVRDMADGPLLASYLQTLLPRRARHLTPGAA